MKTVLKFFCRRGALIFALCCFAVASYAGNFRLFYPATHTGWVLETPSGKVYVIDPGVEGEFYDTPATGGMGIGTYLKRQGIKTIDGMIISHPHGDHYDAGVQMFQDFKVLELIDTGFNANNNNNGGYKAEFWNAFKASGAARRSGLRAGDSLNLDPELTVNVVGPKDPFWTYEESGSDPERHYNQNSLVLWVKHGGISFLFTGDITQPAQNFLRTNSSGKTRDTAILGIPHHGKYYYRDDFANLVGTDHPFVRLGIISEDHTDKGTAADRYDEWQGAGLNLYAGDGNNAVTVTSFGGDEFLMETTKPDAAKIYSIVTNYAHEPFFTATGASYFDVAHQPALALTNFSVSAWIRTSATFDGTKMIVNKGGFLGGESPGQNMNYGIWILASGRIEGGFETTDGANVFVTTPNPCNDGQWHHIAVTYDGTVLKLYLDSTLVSSVNSTSLPDFTGTTPLRIGADASAADRFFTGNIDEVRVWNRSLSAGEIWNACHGGRVNFDGLVANYDMGCVKLNGSNYFEEVSTPQLQLTNFILTARFRTTAPPPSSQVAMIVNKGGFGSDVSGQNMNYGLWIDSNGFLVGGFEGVGGGDYFAESTRTVNDGQWHTAVASFNGSAVVLELDGTEIARTATTTKPNTTGTQPLRIGANSRGNDRYFTDDVDFVQVVNPDVGTVYWNELNVSPYEIPIATPVITGAGKTNSQFSITVQGDTNANYQLLRTTNPGAGSWSSVANPLVATNGTNKITLTDTNAAGSQNFYRVRAE